MFIDWRSNFVTRLVTSIAIVLALIVVFSLRFIPIFGVWFFDVVVLIVAVVATLEMMKVRKSDARGVSITYVLAWLAGAYCMFVFSVIAGFSVWAHIIVP